MTRRVLHWARAALAVLALVAGADAGARPNARVDARPDRIRVLVLVANEEHREIAARIKGQTADLDAIIATAEGALPADLDGQVGVARAVGARADVVVWFGADGDDRVAYIARGDRVRVRRVAAASGALSRSASIEAVALAVRTTLAGFAAGGAGLDDERAPRVRPWGELGWAGVLDGTSGSGRHGLALRLGAARGRWHLGAVLGFHPATTVESAQTSIEIQRQHAGLVLGAELLRGPLLPNPRWSIAAELGVGAVRFPRMTTATETGLVATPAASTWSVVLAPGVRAARRMGSGSWLALGVGFDVLPRPAEFGVQRAGSFERIAAVWSVEPRLTLSILLDRK